ncbi:MAG: hypothetical protein RID91_13620 [Azospirillaceae bacterium]
MAKIVSRRFLTEEELRADKAFTVFTVSSAWWPIGVGKKTAPPDPQVSTNDGAADTKPQDEEKDR